MNLGTEISVIIVATVSVPAFVPFVGLFGAVILAGVLAFVFACVVAAVGTIAEETRTHRNRRGRGHVAKRRDRL